MRVKKINRSDIIHINIYGNFHYNEFMDCMREYFSIPDYDGTTNSCGDGINIIIDKSDLPSWKESVDGFGLLELEVIEGMVDNGHYGDGDWEGVNIVSECQSDEVCYLITNSQMLNF